MAITSSSCPTGGVIPAGLWQTRDEDKSKNLGARALGRMIRHVNADRVLLTIVPAPVTPVEAEVDWEVVEQSIGFAFPDDYRWLVETYGLGQFNGFLWILHPSTANPNLRVQTHLEFARRIYTEVPRDAIAPPDELIPWGSTDNGDVCYWLTNGEIWSSDRWTIGVNEARGPDWDTSDLNVVAWLEAVLSGSKRVSVFPEDFASSAPSFQPFQLVE